MTAPAWKLFGPGFQVGMDNRATLIDYCRKSGHLPKMTCIYC